MKDKIQTVLDNYNIFSKVYDSSSENEWYSETDKVELSINLLVEIQNKLSDITITLSGNYDAGISLWFKK